MPRWFQVHLIRRIEASRSKWARPTAPLLTLLLVMPVAALAQGSPFDTGFNAIQSLFTGTIAKVASLVAIVIGGYGFAHGEPGAKKALAGVAAGTGIAVLAVNVLSWLWGVQRPSNRHPQTRSLMPDKAQQRHRISRVFRSLHKPPTYLVCVGAVGAFNRFNSILAGIAVFIGGFAFGHWVTYSDPAFLRILAKSEPYNIRYDTAKQQVPRVEVA